METQRNRRVRCMQLLAAFFTSIVFVPIISCSEFGRPASDGQADRLNNLAVNVAGKEYRISHVGIVNGKKKFLVAIALKVPEDFFDFLGSDYSLQILCERTADDTVVELGFW